MKAIAETIWAMLEAAKAALRPLRDPVTVEPSFAECLSLAGGSGANGEEPPIDVDATCDQVLEPTPAACEPILGVAHLPIRAERIIPLTRTRLCRRDAITWPTSYDGDPSTRTASERLAILAQMQSTPRPEYGPILARAYGEEGGPERLAVLRTLIAGDYGEAPEPLRQALRAESDAERLLAIDGLARIGCRDGLGAAFEDRGEAIAAKAALAYAGSRRRLDLVASLAPHVRPARLATIMGLLAGALE